MIRSSLFWAYPPPYVNNSHAFTRRRNEVGSSLLPECKYAQLYSYRPSGYPKIICDNVLKRKVPRKMLSPGKGLEVHKQPVSISNAVCPQCKTRKTHYSRKVNRFVCRILIALSASRSSITQDMLISLAPVTITYQPRHVHVGHFISCLPCEIISIFTSFSPKVENIFPAIPIIFFICLPTRLRIAISGMISTVP